MRIPCEWRVSLLGRLRLREGGFLIPVGGLVEPGESPEDAFIREVWEEGRVKIEAPIFIGVLEDVFDYGGEAVNGAAFCYLAEAESIEGFPETA